MIKPSAVSGPRGPIAVHIIEGRKTPSFGNIVIITKPDKVFIDLFYNIRYNPIKNRESHGKDTELYSKTMGLKITNDKIF